MTDFTDLVDLAAEALGGTVIAANDEFFAPKEALLFPTADAGRLTHLRLNIFPDGGVARLRVHGDVRPVHEGDGDASIDLAALENGGFSMICSDMFFGHRQNLILPGRSTHMGNGWETQRRRGPGHDWTIIRLGNQGTIERVELDTDHYKGNAPGECMIEVCRLPGANAEQLVDSTLPWTTIVPKTALQPHGRHRWAVSTVTDATHLRLNIYPDGGVARLRAFGHRTPAP